MTRFTSVLLLLLSLTMTACVGLLESQRVSIEIPERQNYAGAKLTGDIAKIEAVSSELEGRFGREYKSEMLNQTTTEFNMRGDVLSVVSVDDEYPEAESRVYTYNDEGRLVGRVENFSGGCYEHRYTLDEYGCVILDELYSDNGILESRTSIEYDNRGNDVEYVTSDIVSNTTNIVVRLFDDNNLCTEVIRYSGNDEVRSRETYAYDAMGRVVESVMYEGYDLLQTKVCSAYGDNGLDVDRTTYDDVGGVIAHEAQLYDDAGRLVERCQYDASGATIERVVLGYNESGNKISETTFASDDKPIVVRSYLYSDDGLLVEEIEDDILHNSYSVIVYAYDDKHNLIEERAYLTRYKIPQYIVEYAITYRE